MAEENEPEEDADSENTEESEAGSGNKKKLIILVVLGLLIIGISVGGTLAVVTMMSPPPPQDELAEDVEPVETPPPPAIYYPLKPPIIANFDVKGRQRYLQAELTLLTREGDVVSAIELHMPMIRNALVLLVSGQLYEELQTAEGKEFLRLQCLQELQNILQKEIGKPGVEQVLFTNFVMQ